MEVATQDVEEASSAAAAESLPLNHTQLQEAALQSQHQTLTEEDEVEDEQGEEEEDEEEEEEEEEEEGEVEVEGEGEGEEGLLEDMEEEVSSEANREEQVASAHESQLSLDGGSGSVDNNTEPILKRKRTSCVDNGPSVHVSYKCLTRESRKKLQEVLRGWVEWQSQITNSFTVTKGDLLESGSEMYFPALHVGSDSSQKLPVWMDLPATKQAGFEQQPGEILLIDSQEREVEVPLYDRACNSALSSQDSGLQLEQPFEVSEEASRCFNCGSYSHGLKDCPRPRDNAAINAARKLHNSKKGTPPGLRGPSRYYQSSPGGKFDDLKPGVLGTETRQSLGIGELDPPPWLNRMRELGYPPGYLDGGDEEPSGITIFDGDEEHEKKDSTEDGKVMDIRTPETNGLLNKKMTVSFPGLNAPIPKEADENLWKPAPEGRHASAGRYRTNDSATKISLQLTSGGNSDHEDSPSDAFRLQGLQAQSLTLHRSFSDNSQRSRSNDYEHANPMSGDLYRSPSGNSPFTLHDGLLGHPASLLPPRSPSPYFHSPSQHSPSSWHAYDNSRERPFLRPHVHTSPASSQHIQRHSSPSHQRGRNNY